MDKILIFYSSYGGGHKSAANAIKQYIEEHYQENQVTMIDCVEYISKFINKLTTGAYNQMGKKAPWLWKKVYFNAEKGVLSKVSRGANKLMSKKLFSLIKREDVNIVISTHFFATQMVGRLKRKGKLNCKLATILTDFQIHNQWLEESGSVDCYFVANEEMKKAMIEKNVNAEKIFVTGIPMSERFLEKFDRQSILNEFGLEDKKTALFFGGGEMGLGKDKTCKILKTLIEEFLDLQIIAISGKNKVMQEEFNKIVNDTNSSSRVKILEYTKKVPELMSISQVVITKPGGLTSTESLASELPMIIINPLPGQEEQNAEFLERKQVGVWIKKDDDIKIALKSVIDDDNKLKEMKKNIQGLANKRSTRDICQIILEKSREQ